MKKDDKKLIHKALDGEANQSETKKLQQKMESDGRVRSEFEQLKQVVKDTTRIRVDVPRERDDLYDPGAVHVEHGPGISTGGGPRLSRRHSRPRRDDPAAPAADRPEP